MRTNFRPLSLVFLVLGFGCGDAAPDKSDKAAKSDDVAARTDIVKQVRVAAKDCQDISNAVRTWMVLVKKNAPESLKELEAPITRSSDEGFMNAKNDPWGTPYFIERKGDREFLIHSAGPDKQTGTDDDISYP